MPARLISDAQVAQLSAQIAEDFCPFSSNHLEVGGKDTPRPGFLFTYILVFYLRDLLNRNW